jgi:uncharacterized protein (DUF1501 family)
MTMLRSHAPSRRNVLLASGTLFAWSFLPKLAHAEGRDPRFLTIVLRGALDGLATVAPTGDPDWIALRGDDALTLAGKAPALKLNDFFALNPAMPNLNRMFRANEAIIVHAVATPYRERSHFDGQDLLESGLPKPGACDSGWLNRALASIGRGGRVDPRGSDKVLGVGPTPPLIVLGPAHVLSWSPQGIGPASADTGMRLLDLYRHSDAKLANALEQHAQLVAMERAGPSRAALVRARRARSSPKPPVPPRNSWRNRTDRGSARWRSTAGTRTTMKASPAATFRNCWERSMERWRRSKPTWDRRGERPWSRS